MIPATLKTGRIKRLVLFLYVLGASCVEAAPVRPAAEVHKSFYQWLEQQPPQTFGNCFFVTPSGSFMGIGNQLFYTSGVDLSEKFKESTLIAGFEISHTLLLSLVLRLALWINPVIPVYLPVSYGVGWYRYLRLWKSRVLLAWQLAEWGKNTLSETLWPQKKQIVLDLSSFKTGVVIGELDIPVDKTRPIQLNIYTDGSGNGEFNGCDSLSTFDCLINSLRAMGVHRWKLSWTHDTYEVNQWFYQAEKEPVASQPMIITGGNSNRENRAEGPVHHAAGILSALFSETLLQSTLKVFLPFYSAGHEADRESWRGEHSAFVPLGCRPEQECPGLYVAEGMAAENISIKRLSVNSATLNSATGPERFLRPFDTPQGGVILDRSSGLYRIPESVVTVAFEILEELIEEFGYQAVEAIAAGPSTPDIDLPEQPEDSAEPFISDTSDIEPVGSIQRNLVSPGVFNGLIEEGDPETIPYIEILADTLDEYSIKQGFCRAVELNHLDMAEMLLKHLPDDWVNHHLKQVVRRPADMGLRKIIGYLPEKHILSAMAEATNYGLLQAVEILNIVASDQTRDEIILQAAHRGRTEIVSMLLPGRSQRLLYQALEKAHRSGYLITRDLIFDHLDTATIMYKVKPAIFKSRLVRALETDEMDKVNHLIGLTPPELRDTLPALLLRHSSPQSKHNLAVYVANSGPTNLGQPRPGEDEVTSVLKMARGMTDPDRERFLQEQISEGKLSLLPVIFGTFSPALKVVWLLEQAMNDGGAHLKLLMTNTDPVTRDQVLLESVRFRLSQSVIAELAGYSEQPSIRRAVIYATKTGLFAEAEILKQFLPPEPAMYHLDPLQKFFLKNELREARNRHLGRRELGEKFYVYQYGKTAQMLYIIAHGEEVPGAGTFRHTGDYQLSFMAPDGHNLRTNHIEAFLERRFIPKEIIAQGQPVKEYILVKDYNSGWSFKRMHTECGAHNQDLMERKAAPAVISEVRRHFAKTGKSVDFLMVRGKQRNYLSILLHELNQAEWATYNQVVVGCCRGVNGYAPVYQIKRPLTANYLTYAPDLFMRVANYLKVHPAFWNSPVWEYYHPDTAPEIWLNSLENHKDRMVQYVRQTFKRATDQAKKNTLKLQSKAARH